jgi:DNA-directed RNA polymerase subunit F
MDMKSSRPVTAAEAKGILASRKEGGELGYEQAQALENLEVTVKIEPEKADKLREKFVKAGKISQEMASKLIDIRPDSAATVKAILSKDKVEVSEEEINEIIKELA